MRVEKSNNKYTDKDGKVILSQELHAEISEKEDKELSEEDKDRLVESNTKEKIEIKHG